MKIAFPCLEAWVLIPRRRALKVLMTVKSSTPSNHTWTREATPQCVEKGPQVGVSGSVRYTAAVSQMGLPGGNDIGSGRRR